ncbi:MAG: ParB/RepB/Spo0J family partition protein [Bacteroidales bacterium]|nr:ParB/RepB/Spo0J family partition protein [Bacteroidales bacterium]
MAPHKKYPALGRGLDALIQPEEVHTEGSSSINEIPLSLIHPNPNQPRHEFDPEALQELSDSIKEIGIIQPITLRKLDDETYEIIAGERRWRASQMAGLAVIPAYILTANDENVMEMALIENIQRQDLNALEIALAYQHLLEQYGMTQDRLSERVGKKRATVTNYLRLLKLPASIQMALQNRELEMGHARALLSLDNPALQLKVFSEMQREHLSVRKVEELVKRLMQGETVSVAGQKLRPKRSLLSREYALLRDNLSQCFQTKVQFTCSDNGKGKITIPFANEEEMERIVALLDKLKN